jgi:hypothetical protein
MQTCIFWANLTAFSLRLHPGQLPEQVAYTNMCCNLVNHHECFERLFLRESVFDIMKLMLGE